MSRRRHRRPRGHGHRQHVRQVRLDQPGRPPPHGRLRAHARRAVHAGRPAVAARRRLRRGRAHPPVGAAPGRPARVVGIDLDDPAAARRVGEAPGAEPRVPRHEGREPAVRRRRVRRRDGDRGPRARARPRAHGRRDGARGQALAARLGPARAAVARAEHGPRRVPARTSATRPGTSTTGPSARSWRCCRATARSSRRARRSRGRCCSSALVAETARPERRRDGAARRRPTATRAARGSSRSGSRRRASSRSRTSRSPATCWTSSDYGAISLLWSVLFVVISVIYRPVEQLLSRTIADRRARGLHGRPPAARPAARPGAASRPPFLVVALALRGPIEDAFDSATLYWIFVGATLAYAASYFARGYLAGHQWFGLYGGLVLFESVSRFCFPVAVAVGLASGQTAVALGILAAPLASLLVVPWALRRHAAADARRRPSTSAR